MTRRPLQPLPARPTSIHPVISAAAAVDVVKRVVVVVVGLQAIRETEAGIDGRMKVGSADRKKTAGETAMARTWHFCQLMNRIHRRLLYTIVTLTDIVRVYHQSCSQQISLSPYFLRILYNLSYGSYPCGALQHDLLTLTHHITESLRVTTLSAMCALSKSC